MKVRELLNEGTEKLEAAGIDNAAYYDSCSFCGRKNIVVSFRRIREDIFNLSF